MKKSMFPTKKKWLKIDNLISMMKKLEIGGADISEPWALTQLVDKLKLISWY